jgi:tRNA(Ile2) C34 agmatinyltransferase TiaS
VTAMQDIGMLLALAGGIAIVCLIAALINLTRRAPRCGACRLEMQPEGETHVAKSGGLIIYRCPSCGRRVNVPD